MSPRVREESVHPRFQSGASGRPLNFTVRSPGVLLDAISRVDCSCASMTVNLRKALAFAFWRLRQLFLIVSDDGLSDWKAGLVLDCLQIFSLLTVLFSVSLILSRHVELPYPRVWLTVLSFMIVLANQRFFGYGKHLAWLHYKKEFESYSPRARLVGSIITFAVVLSLVALMMVTGYAASKLPH